MRRYMRPAGLGAVSVLLGIVATASADDFIITDDAQWNAGVKTSVNNDAPNNNQIQISSTTSTFPVLWIANAGEDTVSKINTDTDCEEARYETWFDQGNTGPFGGPAPSRTAVDSDGNVFVANRHFDFRPVAVLKILLEGGIDRNGNGVIDTSSDANGNCVIEPAEMIPLVDTNGNGTLDDAELADERVAFIEQIPGTTGHLGRSLCIAPGGNIWTGTYAVSPAYYELSPADGSVLSGPITTGGVSNYGCAITSDGILWGASLGSVMNILDTNTKTYIGGLSHAAFGSNYGIAAGNGLIYLGNASNPYLIYDPNLGADEPDSNPFTGTFYSPFTDTNSLGVGVDGNGDVVQGNTLVRKYAGATNTKIWETPNPSGTFNTRGIIPDSNNDIWAVNLDRDDVTKFRGTDGSFINTVPTGNAPYTYSDATGIGFQISNPSGTFIGILDSGTPGEIWDSVSWNNEPEGSEPAGTSITVEARSADSIAGLPFETYMTVTNGTPGLGKVGQFIQVRATLTPDPAGVSPIVSDIVASTLVVANCDQDDDGWVDRSDIRIINLARNTTVPPGDPSMDIDGNGVINVNDSRQCVLQCDGPRCAEGPPPE